MALIVLATICFFACVFLVFVLIKWIRDPKRRPKTHPDTGSNVGKAQEKKRSHAVGSPRVVERRERFKGRAHRMSTISGRSSAREFGDSEREQMAYERIARSFESGKRS